MKANKTAAALAAVLASTSLLSSAAQADNQWYVTALLQNSELDTVNTISSQQVGGVNRRIDLSADDDRGLNLAVGRTIYTQDNGNNLSLELNYNSTEYDADNIAFMDNDFLAEQGRSEGQFEVDTLLIRAVYQFDLGNLNPYIGLGVGQTDFQVDGRYGGSVGQPNQARPPFITGDDSATAVEVRIGVEYSFTERFGLIAEYSSTDVGGVQFDRRGGGPGGLATTRQEGDFSYDSFNIGLKFSF